MANKIVSIKERLPQDASLPDGVYKGIWGGHVIVVNYDNRTFELNTEIGVRGMNISVVVTITNGVATFLETKN